MNDVDPQDVECPYLVFRNAYSKHARKRYEAMKALDLIIQNPYTPTPDKFSLILRWFNDNFVLLTH